jgi:hypothetical protein
MSSIRNRLLLWYICVNLCSLLVRAGKLNEITRHADAILVGSVESRVETPDSVVFDIAVCRTLKGSQRQSSIHIVHQWTRVGILLGPTTSVIDQHFEGVWFCRKEVPVIGT